MIKLQNENLYVYLWLYCKMSSSVAFLVVLYWMLKLWIMKIPSLTYTHSLSTFYVLPLLIFTLRQHHDWQELRVRTISKHEQQDLREPQGNCILSADFQWIATTMRLCLLNKPNIMFSNYKRILFSFMFWLSML
jgi:hypothetical protein